MDTANQLIHFLVIDWRSDPSVFQGSRLETAVPAFVAMVVALFHIILRSCIIAMTKTNSSSIICDSTCEKGPLGGKIDFSLEVKISDIV